MKLKRLSSVEPRLVMIIALLVLVIGILGSMTYGCILHGRVESRMRATAFADDTTTSATTRVSDAKTSPTAARADMKTTATRARNAATSATVVANRSTSATTAANSKTSATKVAFAAPPSGGMPTRMPRGMNPMGVPPQGGTTNMGSSSLPTTFTKTVEQKGLFGRKPQMAPTLQGILGQSALINGQWVKVGENQGGVKLLELHPNKAVIEFNGSRRELTVWSEMR